MSDSIEDAQEGIDRAQERLHEKAEEGEKAPAKTGWRRLSHAHISMVLIALLAIALSFVESAEQRASNAALHAQMQTSDDWAFYQAKTARGQMDHLEAELLASLPNAGDAAVQARLKAVQDAEHHEENRSEQRAAAEAEAEKRDRFQEQYEHIEVSSRLLRISVVLASVAVGLDLVWLSGIGALLGMIGFAYTLFVG